MNNFKDFKLQILFLFKYDDNNLFLSQKTTNDSKIA